MTTPRPACPSLGRSLVIIGLFGARQICWSRRTLVMIVLLLIPAALALIIRSQAPPGTVEGFRRAGLPNLQLGLVELLSLFYAASLVRDPMEDRTLAFLLTRPLSRVRMVAGLYLGMLLVLIPLAVVSAATGFACTRAGLPEGILRDGEMGGALGRFLAVVALGVILYGALFTLLGLAVRHPTILGLAFILMVDGLLGSLGGPPRRLSPVSYLESLLLPWFTTRASIEGDAAILQGYAVGPGTALLVLGGLYLACLFLVRQIVLRRDFIPYQKSSGQG